MNVDECGGMKMTAMQYGVLGFCCLCLDAFLLLVMSFPLTLHQGFLLGVGNHHRLFLFASSGCEELERWV